MLSQFEIINGDALDAMRDLEERGAAFDAIVADPPYCSGAITPAMTTQRGLWKYVKRKDLGSFDDSMTQYAFWEFSRAWLSAARRLLRAPGYWFLFIDWRQLPTLANAAQAAGLIWRGVAVWNKGNCRPNKGHISQTNEFILWGTAAKWKSDRIVTQGCYSCSPPAAEKRIHPTQKSAEMIAHFLQVLPPDAAAILDPFMGSGAAGVAALMRGLNYCGIDMSADYCEAARRRLEGVAQTLEQTGAVIDDGGGRDLLWA